MPDIGVVVMAYGTPGSLDDIEAYYTHIRRGRRPSPEELDDLRARYEAIGGLSPLTERTDAQRRAIQAALDRDAPTGWRFTCVLGAKHAPPFIEDAVTQLVHQDVDAIVGLVLAPHYSKASVGEYHIRARAAAGSTPYFPIESWHLEPEFLDFQADAVRRAQAQMPPRYKLVFTAHSLPERVLTDDPYPEQLYQSAAAIAERLGLLPYGEWGLAWQSAARTPEPWRGPDIVTVIEDLARTGRSDGIVVCPHGFVADHLEVLYDLDIVARRAASQAGLQFARTEVVNDDPAVMAALARRVIQTAHPQSVAAGANLNTAPRPENHTTGTEPTHDTPTDANDDTTTLTPGNTTTGTGPTHETTTAAKDDPAPAPSGDHQRDATPATGTSSPDATSGPEPTNTNNQHPGTNDPERNEANEPPARRPSHHLEVVVVGAGISGLTTAHAVLRDVPGARVTVVETTERLGGKIKTTTFAGRPVDCAADAFLARVPSAVQLCEELGLGDDLVTPAQRTAYLYVDGQLRRFPEHTVLGVPLDFDALEQAGVLSAEGLARARREPDLPAEQWPPPGMTDESVGALVRRRLGDEVLERLVGPLLGGVNCGSADELSVEAGAPQFATAMREHGSLVKGLRALDAGAADRDREAPVFYGLVGGTQTLTDALAASIRDRGGSILTGTTVTALQAAWLPGRTTPLYTLRLDRSPGISELHADVVVLAVPDFVAARLLGPLAPTFASDLAAVDYASAVLVTMAVRKSQIDHPLDASGFLVAENEGLLLTACSWASSKWSHLDDPELAILRASAGRTTDTRAVTMDDDLLIASLTSDLAATMGLRGEPESVRVSRWPDSLPQFRPGHLERMRSGQAELAQRFPGLFVIGAGVLGLGVPACIAQGNQIASTIADLGLSPREPVKGANQPQH